MRVLAWLLVLSLFALAVSVDPKCGDKEQVQCQGDINAAYPPCKKAAEMKGKDAAVDITCLKYFSQMTE